MIMKYSRQRAAILSFLQTRKDHPTAEVVYENVRMVYPKISLGTVYRNLTLLSETGEIIRLRLGDGVDHFDADTSEHYHVICSGCGSVTDLEMMGAKIPIDTSILPYDGTITGHIIYFTGVCKKCSLKDVQ